MPARFVTLLAALTLGAIPAIAGEPDCSITPESLPAKVARLVPDSQVQHLTGDDAKRFIADLNAMPPQTNLAGDEVEVFTAPHSSTGLVAIFIHGCAAGRGVMSITQINRLLGDGA